MSSSRASGQSGSSAAATSNVAGVNVLLKKLMGKNPDTKAIYIHTYDGIEIISEIKSKDVDVVSNSSTIANFSSSVDQVSRLKLGQCNYTLSWCNNGIVLHAPIDSLVLSMHFEDSANIG